MGSNGICLIHHQEEPKHVPKDCGLPKALNLKFVNVAPAAPSLAPPPLSSTLIAASPSPGGCMVSSATPPTSGLAGSGTALFGLNGVVAITLNAVDDFDSDDDYLWAGNESGVDYCDYHKSNNAVAPYTPSCSSVAVSFISSFTPLALPMATSSLAVVPSISSIIILSSSYVINLSRNLHCLICCVSQSLIGIKSSKCFAVADTGATDHMLPAKSAFISYKAIFNLQVWMGNNSFIPVLGHESAVVPQWSAHPSLQHPPQTQSCGAPLQPLHPSHPAWLQLL